jgi:hypothetical protein
LQRAAASFGFPLAQAFGGRRLRDNGTPVRRATLGQCIADPNLAKIREVLFMLAHELPNGLLRRWNVGAHIHADLPALFCLFFDQLHPVADLEIVFGCHGGGDGSSRTRKQKVSLKRRLADGFWFAIERTDKCRRGFVVNSIASKLRVLVGR